MTREGAPFWRPFSFVFAPSIIAAPLEPPLRSV